GDTAVVGASGKSIGGQRGQGAAYVFVRSGASWAQQAELTAADGAAGDLFGFSVLVSGDTAVIGAYSKTVGGHSQQGAAAVFVRSGASGAQQAELPAADGAAGDLFGYSVSVSGETAVVGARSKSVGGNGRQGAAYVFVRSGTSWTQQAEFTAADVADGGSFGKSVSVSGDTAVVGANHSHSAQGAAYVFVRSGPSWAQRADLTAADGAAFDYFGTSVSISGDTAVIEADGHSKGPAYVFVRSGTSWAQQAELTPAD